MRPGKEREVLTRERVYAEALRLVDTVGLEGLSMRQLGRACGVVAMSLYAHVPNKAAILDGVVEAVYADVRLPEPDPTSAWDEQLAALARAFRDALFRHPGALPVVATRSASGPHALRLSDMVAAALLEAGFAPKAVVHATNGIGVYVIGVALAAVGRTPFAPETTEEQSTRQPGPGELVQYPHLAAVLSAMSCEEGAVEASEDFFWDELFEFGLAAFLTGLKGSRPPPTPR